MLVITAHTLMPVLQEAKDNQCNVLLVKYLGLYAMSDRWAIENGKRRLAYVQVCDPDKDPGWHERCRKEAGRAAMILGGAVSDQRDGPPYPG